MVQAVAEMVKGGTGSVGQAGYAGTNPMVPVLLKQYVVQINNRAAGVEVQAAQEVNLKSISFDGPSLNNGLDGIY